MSHQAYIDNGRGGLFMIDLTIHTIRIDISPLDKDDNPTRCTIQVYDGDKLLTQIDSRSRSWVHSSYLLFRLLGENGNLYGAISNAL